MEALEDMTPRFSCHYLGNDALPYPILAGKLTLRDTAGCVALSYFSYLLLGEHCMALFFAAWNAVGVQTATVAVATRQSLRVRLTAMAVSARRAFWLGDFAVAVTGCHASFRACVCHILRGCAQKQMVRPDAVANIAAVADEEAGRNRSVGKPPRNPMGSTHDVTGNGKFAISTRIAAGRPQPTVATLINFSPEAVEEGWIRGKLIRHRYLLSGVMPSAGDAARGLLHAPIIALQCCNLNMKGPVTP